MQELEELEAVVKREIMEEQRMEMGREVVEVFASRKISFVYWHFP